MSNFPIPSQGTSNSYPLPAGKATPSVRSTTPTAPVAPAEPVAPSGHGSQGIRPSGSGSQIQIGQPGHPGKAPGNVVFVSPEEPKVSEAEIRWATSLEQRILKGYEPTEEETSLYQEILQKLAAPPAPAMDDPVSPQELQWAMDLEERVKMGYQPNAKEIKIYENIYQRLQQAQEPKPQPEGVSQEEINWALQLEQQVIQGYQPTEKEINRYQDIASRLVEQRAQPAEPVAPAAPARSAVTQQEIDWAVALQEKVTQGYLPTQAEIQKYQEIFERYQQSQDTLAPAVPARHEPFFSSKAESMSFSIGRHLRQE